MFTIFFKKKSIRFRLFEKKETTNLSRIERF